MWRSRSRRRNASSWRYPRSTAETPVRDEVQCDAHVTVARGLDEFVAIDLDGGPTWAALRHLRLAPRSTTCELARLQALD